MSTSVLISFSTWVHTLFSCLCTVLLFLTWLYTRFWFYMMQKHPYCEKLSLSLQTRPVIRFATIPDSMTMLGQRWPMVVRARWPNIIKKALAQCNFAHRPYVRPTCWFYVGPSCWPNNKPTCRPYVGPTLPHGCTYTLTQHHKKGVGPM